MEIDIQTLPLATRYKLITGTIVPRPIAWVSTQNAAGQPNLAPFSFFNGICSNPPSLLFCPGVRGTDVSMKDTYNNVKASGEFVVNIVNESLLEKMNITATELPAEINEFTEAGLTAVPATRVNAPRVAESPVNFECKALEIVPVGDGGKGSAWVVIGEILYMHVHDDVIFGDHYIDMRALAPIGRLAGPNYATLGEILEVSRLPSQVKKGE
jgi:flavin reductase (DIM6/NTAB) family NADH-FMN oxidoreductase RutF